MLDKGIPDDAMPGIKNINVSFEFPIGDFIYLKKIVVSVKFYFCFCGRHSARFSSSVKFLLIKTRLNLEELLFNFINW